jgi:hypothetical protein
MGDCRRLVSIVGSSFSALGELGETQSLGPGGTELSEQVSLMYTKYRVWEVKPVTLYTLPPYTRWVYNPRPHNWK